MTWHQRQAVKRALKAGRKIPLIAKKVGWVIVTDPPGEMRTLLDGFPTKEAAEERLRVWQQTSDNKGNFESRFRMKHTYVVPPSPLGRN